MLDSLDVNIIRKIQDDIPIVQEPYKQIAKEIGISQDELLDKINELRSNGIIRRFGAILNHRNSGFTSNAMVVWNIPIKRIKLVSEIMVKFSSISHCYRRAVLKDWPYNIFTMIHGETSEQCEKIVKEISKASEVNDYKILYSVCELKKTSMKYFNDIDIL